MGELDMRTEKKRGKKNIYMINLYHIRINKPKYKIVKLVFYIVVDKLDAPNLGFRNQMLQ